MSSLRQLAAQLDLSHATVSAALRNMPGVRPATRERVLQAAGRVGYRANPLASALMGEMRRSRGLRFRGTLAVLGRSSAERAAGIGAGPSRDLLSGARRRAGELGFEIDEIQPGKNGWDPDRMTGALEARGIRGLLVLDSPDDFATAGIDWSRFPVVQAGMAHGAVRFDSVRPDYVAAMSSALHQVRRLGYARPGLALDADSDARVRAAWIAAYHVEHLEAAACDEGSPPPRPLILRREDALSRFADWRALGGHDVILSDCPRLRDWLLAAKSPVAGGTGFCGLAPDSPDESLAHVDLRLPELGAKAVHLLVERVLRNEAGPGHIPATTMVAPEWVPGSSLRQARDKVAV